MSVPKLRFKEFDGAWSIKPLKNICKINQGLQIAIENRFTDDGVNRYFYITNEFLREGAKKTYFIENPPRNVICDENDILMTRTGNTGQVVTDVKGAFHNNFFKIDFDRSIINKNFFIEFLKKDTTQHLILKYAGASTIPDLNHSDFYRIVMPITTIKEQTKIASFLSNVDEKISQLTEKHALLSQYKQGMMQKLFSQQLRFKADDGSEFGEWEDSKLGELTTLITKGTTPSSLGEKYEESGINFIKIESLSSNGKFLLDKFAYIDENTHNKLARSKLEHDDILFSIAGALGRVAIISRDYLPANTNQALAIIRLKDKKITRYIYYFLNSDYVKKIIDAESVQLAQANFSLGQLANLDVLVPCLEEQTKIANFLSAIDQKIEVVAQQIEQAKQWKKGLLQQMFV